MMWKRIIPLALVGYQDQDRSGGRAKRVMANKGRIAASLPRVCAT